MIKVRNHLFHPYHFNLTGIGDVLTGRVYQESDPGTPIAFVARVNNTYGSGVTALYDFSNTGGGLADATFDNFGVTPIIPEPSVLMLMGMGALGSICRFLSRRRVVSVHELKSATRNAFLIGAGLRRQTGRVESETY